MWRVSRASWHRIVNQGVAGIPLILCSSSATSNIIHMLVQGHMIAMPLMACVFFVLPLHVGVSLRAPEHAREITCSRVR